jgi:hypothetical protein
MELYLVDLIAGEELQEMGKLTGEQLTHVCEIIRDFTNDNELESEKK